MVVFVFVFVLLLELVILLALVFVSIFVESAVSQFFKVIDCRLQGTQAELHPIPVYFFVFPPDSLPEDISFTLSKCFHLDMFEHSCINIFSFLESRRMVKIGIRMKMRMQIMLKTMMRTMTRLMNMTMKIMNMMLRMMNMMLVMMNMTKRMVNMAKMMRFTRLARSMSCSGC